MHVPVLIVGGGACGLSLSAFLSDLGVDHLLLERHAGTAVLPKAGSYTQRTMEIFRRHGLAEEIYRLGPQPEQVSKVAFYTSLAGDGPLDRRRLHIAPFLGFAEPDRSIHERDSPARCAVLPQWDLEPVLRAEAERRGPGRVRFGQELVSVSESGEQVTAVVRDRESGEEYRVLADHVVAADGGRSIGPAIGMVPTGPTGLADMVSVIFSADLGDLLPEDDVIIWFFVNPEGGPYSSGVLVPQGSGAAGWGRGPRDVRKWRINIRFAPGDPAADLDETNAADLVRTLLHTDDLDLSVIGISHWSLEAVLAERFRVGRILLAGDAAHRQPPTTGLGLNSAVQDAHNLAWKLAAVTRGWAPDALLDTYEQERRPVDGYQVEFAMFTFQNLGRTLVAGLGVGPEMSSTQREAVFAELLSDTPFGATRRAVLEEVWRTQRIEFNPHDLDLGYSYSVGAVVPDGSEAPPRDPMGVEYVPTSRPGHRLPHAWLETASGERVSVHDLVPLDGFALITGSRPTPWEGAAATVASEFGVPLVLRPVDDVSAEHRDRSGHWSSICGIAPDGAILVRPDGFVGWRAVTAPSDPTGALRQALAGVLQHVMTQALVGAAAMEGNR